MELGDRSFTGQVQVIYVVIYEGLPSSAYHHIACLKLRKKGKIHKKAHHLPKHTVTHVQYFKRQQLTLVLDSPKKYWPLLTYSNFISGT